MNEFGLFGDVRGKRIKIHTAEKTTKYLLSFKYIPANYDAIIIGPSISDQLDPRKISGYKTYNLSLLSGNVRELKLSVKNVLERGKIKLLIICLHPYLTRDNILKDQRLTPHMYWSSLGSTFTFKLYNDMLSNHLDPGKNSFNDSADGYSRPIHVKGITTEQFIDKFRTTILQAHGKPLVPLDPVAYSDLRDIINLARAHNVRIIAYHHPEPEMLFRLHEKNHADYLATMSHIFAKDDLVYDFNTSEYREFRSDLTNYIDHGHLSEKGAAVIVAELDRVIKSMPHASSDKRILP